MKYTNKYEHIIEEKYNNTKKIRDLIGNRGLLNLEQQFTIYKDILKG